MKNKMIGFLLVLHLLAIFLGTNLVDFAKVPSVLRAPVAWYLSITGGHPYSFFSPDIPTQVIVRCSITDTSGQVLTETFDKKTNTFELRANCLFQLLVNDDDPETAAQIAANYCFKKHAKAKSVKISIGRFIVSPIHDSKQGMHSGFSELFTQTFRHE